jgi:peptide/nickel transport system permease protein
MLYVYTYKSNIRAYLLRRVLIAIIAFFVISFVIFSIIHLPGEETIYLPSYMDMGAVERNLKEYNWSDPLIINYARWMGNIFRGDLGESLINYSYYLK